MKRWLMTSTGIGIFIGLFLIVFQPFGTSSITDETFRIAFLGGYGLLTIVICIIYGFLLRFLFPKWMDEKSWTTGKEILATLTIIFIVSICNLFYTNIIFHRNFETMQVPYWAGVTLVVSIIPVSFSVMLRQGKMTRESEGMAEEINGEIEHRKEEALPKAEPVSTPWIFISENEKEKVEADEKSLLFIESADNYSTFYMLENNELKKLLLRGSLKRMEEQAGAPSLYRCHRTYIVNLSKVISVSGNAQGYRLHFDGTENTVPVSRNLGKELKQKLE
ncbi:MAG: LytTR family DNA-binding domain-containing protein [Bacteroidia bacterium]